MHFDSLSVKTSTIEPKPLRMILRIDRFSSGGIVLDTITTGIWQNGSGLNYLLRLANSPGNMDNVAQIALFGRAQGNRGQPELQAADALRRARVRFRTERAMD